MLPKAIMQYKHTMAIMIQKHLRGYLVAHKKYCELRNSKIEINLSFFDTMRREVHDGAASKI